MMCKISLRKRSSIQNLEIRRKISRSFYTAGVNHSVIIFGVNIVSDIIVQVQIVSNSGRGQVIKCRI